MGKTLVFKTLLVFCCVLSVCPSASGENHAGSASLLNERPGNACPNGSESRLFNLAEKLANETIQSGKRRDLLPQEISSDLILHGVFTRDAYLRMLKYYNNILDYKKAPQLRSTLLAFLDRDSFGLLGRHTNPLEYTRLLFDAKQKTNWEKRLQTFKDRFARLDLTWLSRIGTMKIEDQAFLVKNQVKKEMADLHPTDQELEMIANQFLIDAKVAGQDPAELIKLLQSPYQENIFGNFLERKTQPQYAGLMALENYYGQFEKRAAQWPTLIDELNEKSPGAQALRDNSRQTSDKAGTIDTFARSLMFSRNIDSDLKRYAAAGDLSLVEYQALLEKYKSDYPRYHYGRAAPALSTSATPKSEFDYNAMKLDQNKTAWDKRNKDIETVYNQSLYRDIDRINTKPEYMGHDAKVGPITVTSPYKIENGDIKFDPGEFRYPDPRNEACLLDTLVEHAGQIGNLSIGEAEKLIAFHYDKKTESLTERLQEYLAPLHTLDATGVAKLYDHENNDAVRIAEGRAARPIWVAEINKKYEQKALNDKRKYDELAAQDKIGQANYTQKLLAKVRAEEEAKVVAMHDRLKKKFDDERIAAAESTKLKQASARNLNIFSPTRLSPERAMAVGNKALTEFVSQIMKEKDKKSIAQAVDEIRQAVHVGFDGNAPLQARSQAMKSLSENAYQAVKRIMKEAGVPEYKNVEYVKNSITLKVLAEIQTNWKRKGYNADDVGVLMAIKRGLDAMTKLKTADPSWFSALNKKDWDTYEAWIKQVPGATASIQLYQFSAN
jgi:hypothetical protein